MSSSRQKSSSSSSSKKPSKPKTLEELRHFEQAQYVDSLLTSHGGYLKPIILSLSSAFEISPTTTSAALGALYLMLHLITPAFLLPHLSAVTTLMIPVTATMQSIALEKDKKKSSEAKDSSQWCLYWVTYCIFELARGWISIWTPGCKAVFEMIRTAGLITVGGPWFGYAGLRPPGPSEELRKLEKAEAAKEKERKAKDERDKAKQDKAKAEKAKKESKEKAKGKGKEGKEDSKASEGGSKRK